MERLTLADKAWRVDYTKIDEGYLSAGNICYCNTRGQAKSKIWEQVKYDGWKLLASDDELSFINLPVVRAKELDKYHFEGNSYSKYEIEEILYERSRIKKLDELLNNDNIQWCYIRKGSYYKPNSCGYTDFKIWAGVYSKTEAVKHAKSCKGLTIVPINISEHNKMIQDEIENLQTRIISVDVNTLETNPYE